MGDWRWIMLTKINVLKKKVFENEQFKLNCVNFISYYGEKSSKFDWWKICYWSYCCLMLFGKKLSAKQRLHFVLLAVSLLHELTSQLRTHTHTHSSVSRTDACSHHHLTGSWWLQKENSEQQPSTFQRHRLSESLFNNSCITAQCRFPIKYLLPIAHYFPL